LGLALVKGLVERHGGCVSGHSDGPDCGSDFIVTLPLLALAEPAPAIDAPAEPGGLRLLIVDDNRDAAETLAMYLAMLGHDTHVAFSAQDGLDEAARLAPHACLLDVGLPDMSGHELARRMQALPATAGATLIAITGYGSASDRAESADAGFHHHLTKPVDTGELAALLAGVAGYRVSMMAEAWMVQPRSTFSRKRMASASDTVGGSRRASFGSSCSRSTPNAMVRDTSRAARPSLLYRAS
jgi:CheY-like chemotaxis protein